MAEPARNPRPQAAERPSAGFGSDAPANDNAPKRPPLWARSAMAERGSATGDANLDPSADVDTPDLQIRRTRPMRDGLRGASSEDAADDARRLRSSSPVNLDRPAIQGPKMSKEEIGARERIRKRSAQRKNLEEPSRKAGGENADDADPALKNDDHRSRLDAMRKEMEYLRRESATLDKQRGMLGALNRFRNARDQAKTKKALEKLKARQMAGLTILQLLYGSALFFLGHTIYVIIVIYLLGRYSSFLRRYIPALGSILEPKARLEALRGEYAQPSVGAMIAEGLALSVMLMLVMALDIMAAGIVVGVYYAMSEFCDMAVVGWTCDIVGAIGNFFF